MNYTLEALKGGIREYINILIAIETIYDNKNSINYLEDIYNSLDDIFDIEELKRIKNDITNIQNNTVLDNNKKIVKDCTISDRELTEREKGLVNRGYSKEDVFNISSFSNDQIEIIADVIISNISKNIKNVNNPICVFIGGQPGCGKSTTSIMMLKDSFINDGAIEIGIDNYRPYHPNYLKMEEIIKKHWENRIKTEDDSPGNDIADFTHHFASVMSDYIVNKIINNDLKYNLIIEWGMRTPDEPLNMMKILKEKGYSNIVDFVVVNKKASFDACVARADTMEGLEHIIRRIPKYFHDICVSTIPDSCNKIYETGYINNNYISHFILTSRDGDYIWDNTNEGLPGDLYRQYLNND